MPPLCLPTSLSIQLATVAPEHRHRAVATWTAATGLGGAVGNVVGGSLISLGGWRGLFWGFLPVGLGLPGCRDNAIFPKVIPHPRPLDLSGAALTGLGFVALLAGLVEGPAQGWDSGLVLGCFAASVVLIGSYVLTALRRAHPLLDPRLFAIPEVRASALGIVSIFVALFGLFLSYGQYLQLVKGESPAVAGVAVLPLVVPFFLCSRAANRLVTRWGAPRTAQTGMVIAAVGVLLISTWSASTSYLTFAATIAVAGVGMGLAGPPLSQSLVAALPVERAGVGATLNSTAREVGSALGVAVVGTVTGSRFAHAGFGHRSAGAVIGGLQGSPARSAENAFAHASGTGLQVAAGLLLLGTALTASWMRKRVELEPSGRGVYAGAMSAGNSRPKSDPTSWGEAHEKSVEWHDPMATALAGASLSGLEYLQKIVDGELPPAPIAVLMGFTAAEVKPGEVTFFCTPDTSVYNPIGMVHGGLVCTLLDSVVGCAVHTTLPVGTAYTSLELKVSYLRAVRAGDKLTAKGWVTKPGRRAAFAEGEVRDDEGRLVATASTTCLVFPLA